MYYEQNRGRTALVSPPFATWPFAGHARWSDGSSDHIAFSQDNRYARLVAFDSSADDLVPGDVNGARDVFVMRRNPGEKDLGGSLALASVSTLGGQANGPSSNPSLDGSTRQAPHCVAFESEATNLDPRDTSPDTDVYVRDLRARRTELVSPARDNATRPVIDGACRTVTFAAEGNVWLASVASTRVWLLARGDQPDQQTNGRGVAYVRNGQVWYRSFSLRGNALRRGREQIVSDDRKGRRGNGQSTEPALDDVGNYVAFVSTATNLCVHRCAGVSRDGNGPIADVFRRTLTRHAPTHDSMEMASGRYPGQLNRASHDPNISAAGENIIFTSDATNVRRASPGYGVSNPSTAVFTWSFPRARGSGNLTLVNRPGCYQICFAPDFHPAMSSRGNYVGYTSPMTEFCVPDRPRFDGDRDCPATTDVFIHYMGPAPG